MEFDYYLFNSYIPEADGDGATLYGKWMEQVVAADELGFGCAWLNAPMRLFATEVAPHFMDDD